jgi:hypothetical protein
VSKRGQLDVRYLVAREEDPSQPRGTDDLRFQRWIGMRVKGGLKETRVERGVVGDQHRVAEKLQQARQHDLDRLLIGDHGVGDAGQRGDHRWDRHPGIDQRVEGPRHLATTDLDDTDLGYLVRGWRASGGL